MVQWHNRLRQARWVNRNAIGTHNFKSRDDISDLCNHLLFVQLLQIMTITMTCVAKINSEYSNCTKADTCSHIICIGIMPSEMVVKIICRHGSDTTKIVHRRQHKRPVKSLDLLPIVDIAAGGIFSCFCGFRGSLGHTWLALCFYFYDAQGRIGHHDGQWWTWTCTFPVCRNIFQFWSQQICLFQFHGSLNKKNQLTLVCIHYTP